MHCKVYCTPGTQGKYSTRRPSFGCCTLAMFQHNTVDLCLSDHLDSQVVEVHPCLLYHCSEGYGRMKELCSGNKMIFMVVNILFSHALTRTHAHTHTHTHPHTPTHTHTHTHTHTYTHTHTHIHTHHVNRSR